MIRNYSKFKSITKIKSGTLDVANLFEPDISFKVTLFLCLTPTMMAYFASLIHKKNSVQ